LALAVDAWRNIISAYRVAHIRSSSSLTALMLPSLGRDMDSLGCATRGQSRTSSRNGRVRFHDLRGSHETALLDSSRPAAGMIRLSWLRTHAKRTQKADTSAANIIANMSKAALGTD